MPVAGSPSESRVTKPSAPSIGSACTKVQTPVLSFALTGGQWSSFPHSSGGRSKHKPVVPPSTTEPLSGIGEPESASSGASATPASRPPEPAAFPAPVSGRFGAPPVPDPPPASDPSTTGAQRPALHAKPAPHRLELPHSCALV